MFGYYFLLIASWLITIAIAFYVIRSATRANEQVSLLKELLIRQDAIIKAVTNPDPLRSDEIKGQSEKSKEPTKTDEDYLIEARKRAGLI